MKTSEVYLEQALIGSLVVLTFAFPWLPEFLDCHSVKTVTGVVAGGSILLGLAFWLGIPFDRFADTLTDRLDRHGRLRFALYHARGQEFPKGTGGGKLKEDLYPEDQYRVKGLRDSDAVVDWIDYHRSRIRLTRALWVFAPAATLTGAIGVWRRTQDDGSIDAFSAIVPVFGGYLLWAVLSSAGNRLPRTYEEDFRAYAERWKWLAPKGETLQKAGTGGFRVWLSEWPLLISPLALLVLSIAVACKSRYMEVWGVAVIGAALSVIAAWSWWRISFTYRSYLADLADTPRDSISPSIK